MFGSEPSAPSSLILSHLHTVFIAGKLCYKHIISCGIYLIIYIEIKIFPRRKIFSLNFKFRGM